MNFKDKLTNNLYNYIIIMNNYKQFLFRGDSMRKTTNINSDWEFTINRKTETVNLPHTWNAVDGQSQRDYLRGTGVYTKTLPKYENCGGVYLEISAANTKCRVYLNDIFLGEHINGYSMFRFEITPYLTFDENILKIYVDNSHDEFLYPQTADFTFYGGLYRDVNLIEGVSGTHFALLDKSRTGIYITSKKDGTVYIKSNIEGAASGLEKRFTVYAADGSEVARAEIPAAKENARLFIENPVLWNGRKNPYLYTVKCELLKNGEAIDCVTERFGIRDYDFDSENGFFLNGEPLKMQGVSRHQDREFMGNALTEKEHREDVDLICDIGANAVRLAHYQQSDFFYSLCDEKGLLVWAEIPVISKFSKKKQAQAKLMLEELIRQNYNHPSIFCWGVENEVTMGLKTPSLVKCIKELNTIAHTLDKSRPTTCAQISFEPTSSELNRITNILGYNHYFGWYMQTADEIARWLDKFHTENPNLMLCLSEYGAEAITTLHSEMPVQGDYSEEYQAVFHEKYLKAINERRWLWGSFVWNMFDFGSASRDEGGVKGRNNKGLVTIDRKIKKDSFYLYKAHWSDEKFVYITGERRKDRLTGEREIKVYSNCSEITLTVNGEAQTLKADRIFIFKANILPGENIITAVSGECTHTITVNGVSEENPDYALKEGEHSFVRNWFEASDEINPDCLSLNDDLGTLVNNGEVQKLMKTHLGKSLTVPSPLTKIPLKPVYTLVSKNKKGKELTDLANQFLQTVDKD